MNSELTLLERATLFLFGYFGAKMDNDVLLIVFVLGLFFIGWIIARRK